MAVAEGSCEVGTTYYSDIYGYEDDIKILEKVSSDLTGDVIYPIAQIVNKKLIKSRPKRRKILWIFFYLMKRQKCLSHIILIRI